MNRQHWSDGQPIIKPSLEKDKVLYEKVFMALGEASMCWSETPRGVFDSTNANRIGEELIKYIEEYR